MPFKDHHIEKKYYTITEVAKELRIPTSAIRFWEKHIDMINPIDRRAEKMRRYTTETFEMIKDTSRLTSKGKDIFTLNGMNEYLKFKYRR